jgi:hypothetical protein
MTKNQLHEFLYEMRDLRVECLKNNLDLKDFPLRIGRELLTDLEFAMKRFNFVPFAKQFDENDMMIYGFPIIITDDHDEKENFNSPDR